ncbi:MAG: GNAT family N-acetyltransferase [Hyphomicrobiales bacterium]|nr:MAG: GNAT family N-acetyltransferase [Hyphomicrobiales bacterium]
MSDYIRLRKTLDTPVALPPIPEGLTLMPLWQTRPVDLHTLLRESYATGGGAVGDFESWWWPLVEDEEFDPNLVIIATDGARPVGLIQCWTSGFVKDLVVTPTLREHGLGSYLLNAAFARFQQRGAPQVDLKVKISNLSAQRFYRRHGMVPAETT